MYLAYLDDSDTKKRPIKIQVMSGVIIRDVSFKMFDIAMRTIRDGLVPDDRLDSFEEFHAAELYGGYGVFEGIEKEKRFAAITKLLKLLEIEGTAVVYGAVDITKTKREVYGSADPLDIAFRICIHEIYEWVRKQIFSSEEMGEDEQMERWLNALVLLIVDDCEKKQRDVLQNSFRNLRHPLPSLGQKMATGERLVHFHDDVFFGDSRYSVGIQLADLCSYFIARHLQGDEEISSFYELIQPNIVFGQLYPDEDKFRTQSQVLNNLALWGGLLSGGNQAPEVPPDDGGDSSL